MRRALFLAGALVALFACRPVYAALDPWGCRVGFGSGATLLFPYFEVDLSGYDVTTLIAIGTVDEGDWYVARVVMWTDWAVPTLAFDLWLDPNRVETMNLRDVLNGVIPSTGERAAEEGRLGSRANCDVLRPVHSNPALSPDQRAQLVASHTGVGGPLDSRCAGAFHGDQIARGYITVDVVGRCSGLEAIAPVFTPRNYDYPYFDDAGGGSGGIAMEDPVLWGDIVYIDTVNDSAQGTEAVSIGTSNEHQGAHVFTFYGRYSGWDTRDNRAPLGYRWYSRFLNGGSFAGGADIIVWRDTNDGYPTPVRCGDQPSWAPLHDFTTAVSEDGRVVSLPGDNRFPLATQRVAVSSLGVPFDYGKLIIGTPYRASQMWVQATLKAHGFSAAWNAATHQSLCGLPWAP